MRSGPDPEVTLIKQIGSCRLDEGKLLARGSVLTPSAAGLKFNMWAGLGFHTFTAAVCPGVAVHTGNYNELVIFTG